MTYKVRIQDVLGDLTLEQQQSIKDNHCTMPIGFVIKPDTLDCSFPIELMATFYGRARKEGLPDFKLTEEQMKYFIASCKSAIKCISACFLNESGYHEILLEEYKNMGDKIPNVTKDDTDALDKICIEKSIERAKETMPWLFDDE